MRTKLLLAFAACLFAGHPGVVCAGDEGVFPVGHGSVADEQYPWHVRLYNDAEDAIGFCGGALITPQWVLTAAHCVVNPKTGTVADGIVVGYGSADRTKTMRAPIANSVVHPDYASQPKADIALIRLDAPLADAHPIAIANASDELAQPGAKLTVVGWGALWEESADEDAPQLIAEATRPGGQYDERIGIPRKLHAVEAEVIDPGNCSARLEAANAADTEVAPEDLCTSWRAAQTMWCYGDSGGPLIAWSEQSYVQVGLVRWEPQCGNPDYPGVQLRVAPFADWIADQVSDRN